MSDSSGSLRKMVIDEAQHALLVVLLQTGGVEGFCFFEVVGALVGREGEVDATNGDL